jgi:hypothetical protein
MISLNKKYLEEILKNRITKKYNFEKNKIKFLYSTLDQIYFEYKKYIIEISGMKIKILNK